MKKTVITIPLELNNNIQACQVELDGLKSLIGYLLSTTEYEISTSKIEDLQNKFINKNKEYNELKAEVEKLIPEDFDRIKTSWNLDFATSAVEVIEN